MTVLSTELKYIEEGKQLQKFDSYLKKLGGCVIYSMEMENLTQELDCGVFRELSENTNSDSFCVY